jgi:uncharacterized membrane protein
MKSKELEAESMLGTPEKRAQGCPVSGHSKFSIEGTESHRDAKSTRQRMISPAWVLMLFLGIPAVLSAQKQPGEWSDLNRLKAGQGIEVIESRMQRHAGKLVTFTDEVLTLQEGGSELSIKREDVVRVSTASGAKRGEHAVIGLVVGGAIGAAVGAASGSSTGFLGGSSRGLTALVGIAIGAPSGALVGAVVPAHTTVYRAARVAPIGSNDSSGLGISIQNSPQQSVPNVLDSNKD